MTAKEIRQRFLEQCNGDKKMATDLYEQIKRSFYENEKIPLNRIIRIDIVRNDYLDKNEKENPHKTIWIESCFIRENVELYYTNYETCLSYEYC